MWHDLAGDRQTGGGQRLSDLARLRAVRDRAGTMVRIQELR
jgi:hypothetical protein